MNKAITINKILAWAVNTLRSANIESAVLDSEVLLSFSLEQQKSFLYSHPEFKLSKIQLQNFKRSIIRRAKGEPVAYITGHKEFYGLDFLVNKHVLIPRPETELMVGEVLSLIQNSKFKIQNYILIDIGTGSGCIPIAIAKNVNRELRIMNYGLDISSSALKVAHKNAKVHGVENKIKFLKSNLLTKIHNSPFIIHNSSLIVTANLPYLSEKLYQQNYADLKYEPKNALVAGRDGLKYYRQLLSQVKLLITTFQSPISDHQSQITCFLEIDSSQTALIKKLIGKILPDAKNSVKKDLAGKNRLIIIKYINNRTGYFFKQR